MTTWTRKYLNSQIVLQKCYMESRSYNIKLINPCVTKHFIPDVIVIFYVYLHSLTALERISF